MEIKDLVLQKPRFNALAKQIRNIKSKNSERNIIQLKGLRGSSGATFLSPLKNAVGGLYLFILNDADTAGYFYHDLCQITGDDRVSFFPSGYKRSIKYGQIDSANEILRTETMGAVNNFKENTDPQASLVIVTYPEALAEKVAQADDVKEKLIHIQTGQHIDSKHLIDTLNAEHFQRVDYVYEPGQFAVRGSIIDVFSFSSEYPFRIDFFGNEIDSLRTFEVDSQLSKDRVDEITIAPNFDADVTKGISLVEFVPDTTFIICEDYDWIAERITSICHQEISEQLLVSEEGDLNALKKIVDDEKLNARLKTFHTIVISDRNLGTTEGKYSVITFNTTPQPEWHKNFDLISEDLRNYVLKGYTLHILSDSPKQLDRIEAIFEDRQETFHFVRIPKAIHSGFVDDDTRNCYFTDHQIFDRYHKYSLKSDRARSGKIALSIKELKEFNINDYIVHVDHGVARFGGLVQMPTGIKNPDGTEKMQEMVKLIYLNNDLLFVSIHQLDKLSKYRSRDAEPPSLSRLGSGAWEKMKERTKEKMKDMARELILLYAARKDEEGFAFSPDSNMQHEMEASFIYEDTPDQLKATQDVKRDMESKKPMDRLVCGDVGFGKTEVAIRAALKACNDCKQVAVLVPTTVLAFQHFKTFSQRLKDFPVRVDYLTRARTAKQTKDILSKLADGTIDIIIGTHKLIGKKVKFNDLGLLIIDEEQKFGVATKEALKRLRVNVDTLTMTATPIPRTLQFSLMGARDLSIISTPPANRYPIQTEVHRDDDTVIQEAINFELSRNGQVFYINNRISQLPDIVARIKRLVPDARVAFAHGQMEPEIVEQLILDFADYEYDVLVCTTIIEAGLDIPNANTIIINNAHNFGLSELHQLRGRVGRTNKKAFCYLLSPSYTLLTQDARRRLQAIENFSGLGSGIHLAMQDLDIRGAGNLLGGEQSGFIADLGYEAYQKILKQAIKELKTKEFAQLYQEEMERSETVSEDCSLETDLDICFGESYVPDSGERIALYQELDNLTKESEVEAYKTRLIDRFGAIPPQGEELIRVVALRQLGRELGFEKMILRENRLRCVFLSGNDDYFQSKVFERIINFYAAHATRCKLDERNGKRYLVVDNIKSIKDAVNYLKRI